MRSNLKSPLYRDSSKGILFGVCAGLGEKFDVDPFFIRLLFVFLFFFYGTGVFAYLVLAILMKDKADVEKPRNPLAEAVPRVAERAAEAVASIPATTVSAANSFFVAVGRIVGFAFFGIAAVVLASVSFGFFALFGIARSDFSIGNETLFAQTHPAMAFAALAAGVALFVLGWMSGSKAAGKPVGNGWVALLAGLALAGSFAAGSYGSFQTVSRYSHRETVEKPFETSFSSGELTVSFRDPSGSNKGFELPRRTEIRFERAKGNTVAVRDVLEASAPDAEAAKNVLSKASAVSVSMTGGVLELENVDLSFTEKVPFSFATRAIVLSVPDAVRVRFANVSRDVSVRGIRTTDLDREIGGRACEGGAVRFGVTTGDFGCDVSAYDEKTVSEAKARLLEEERRATEENFPEMPEIPLEKNRPN